jgi:hypothetical protein
MGKFLEIVTRKTVASQDTKGGYLKGICGQL